MYIPDLAPYSYGPPRKENDGLLAIGWLERGHAFTTGAVSEEFLDVLFDACATKPVNVYRGWHLCDLCDDAEYPIVESRGSRREPLGHAEVRVTAPDGTRFAAPELVYHYVSKHGYRPPDAFIDAVLRGTFDEPPPPLPGSFRRLRSHPLDESDPELARRIRERIMVGVGVAGGESPVPIDEMARRLAIDVMDGERDGAAAKAITVTIVTRSMFLWDGTHEDALAKIDEKLATPSVSAFWKAKLRKT